MKDIWKMAFLSTLFVFTACKGGGIGGSSGVSSSYTPTSVPTAVTGALVGTAATGAPLALADVQIRGIGACSLSTKTNSSGVYSVYVDNCLGPYIIKVSGAAGTVHSVIDEAGKIANVTPLTTIVAARVLGAVNIDDEIPDASEINENAITSKVNEVKTALQPLLNAYSAGNIDIVSGAFAANGSGLDRVLDSIKLEASGADLVASIKNTAASVTFPPVNAPTSTGDLNAAVTTVASSMDDLDQMERTLNALVSQSNYTSYCSSSFKESGFNCAEFFADDDGGLTLEYKITRPSYVEKNGDLAWVSFEILARTVGSNTDWKSRQKNVLLQMKKEGGAWKAYGNQVQHHIEMSSRKWTWDSLADDYKKCSGEGLHFSMLDNKTEFDFTSPFKLKVGENNPIVIPFLNFEDPVTHEQVFTSNFDYFNMPASYKPCVEDHLIGGQFGDPNYLKLSSALSGKERFIKVQVTYKPIGVEEVTSPSFYILNPNLGENPELPVLTGAKESTQKCFTRVDGFANNVNVSGLFWADFIWAQGYMEGHPEYWTAAADFDIGNVYFPYAPTLSTYTPDSENQTPYIPFDANEPFTINMNYVGVTSLGHEVFQTSTCTTYPNTNPNP